jgi:hypothetical protein
MKRRYLVVVALLLLVAACFIVWFSLREPEFNGKRVTVWLNDFGSQVDTRKARNALNAIGPDAAPHIFRRLQANQPSKLRVKFREFRAKAPRFIQRWLPPAKSSFGEVDGVNALVAVGDHLGEILSP